MPVVDVGDGDERPGQWSGEPQDDAGDGPGQQGVGVALVLSGTGVVADDVDAFAGA
jgi:hypothetical protein